MTEPKDLLLAGMSMSTGDWVFVIVGLFGIFFIGELIIKIVSHVVSIGESFFMASLKIAFVLAIMAIILPLTTILDTNGLRAFFEPWIDTVVSAARVLVRQIPTFS